MTHTTQTRFDGAGLWLMDFTPGLLARVSGAGFEWFCLDRQHGRFERSDLIAALGGLPENAPPVMVRVASGSARNIGEALDAGAAGVIVPSIAGVDQAAEAVAAAFYPPMGVRSWGQYAGLRGGDPKSVESSNADTMCAIMVETAGALEDVERIAALPGVGMLFVGPWDLALSLATTSTELLADGEAIRRVVKAAQANGIVAGGFGITPESARRMRELGLTFVAVADEGQLLAAGAEAILSR
jgi:4-hydroxy-2-oxoheptanedioate aldolase